VNTSTFDCRCKAEADLKRKLGGAYTCCEQLAPCRFVTKAISCLTGGDINSSLTASELAFPEVKEFNLVSATML